MIGAILPEPVMWAAAAYMLAESPSIALGAASHRSGMHVSRQLGGRPESLLGTQPGSAPELIRRTRLR